MKYYIVLFGKQIPLYGLFFYIGIFAAALLAVLLCKRKKIEKFDIVCSAIYTMIGAIVGSKLLFLIVSFRQIIELQLDLVAIIKGGFVFYGGFLGGLLGLFIYAKQFKLEFLPLLNLYATVLPLGHAFGRVGCFFGGCCYGVPHQGFLSVTYEETLGLTPLHTPLLAIQLIEAFFLLVIFAILLIVFLRTKDSFCFATNIYLFCYSLLRFTLEFWRGDAERGGLWSLSTSQWVSLGLFIAAIILTASQYKKMHSLK